MTSMDLSERVYKLEGIASCLIDKIEALEARCAEYERREKNGSMPEISKKREKEEQAKNKAYSEERQKSKTSSNDNLVETSKPAPPVKAMTQPQLHKQAPVTPVRTIVKKSQPSNVKTVAKQQPKKKVIGSDNDSDILFDDDDDDSSTTKAPARTNKKVISLGSSSDDSDDDITYE